MKTPSESPAGPKKPGFPGLFWIFFRIGALTLGGGLVMLGILRHELVDRRSLLESGEFNDMISLGTSVPGAMAVNVGFLVGHRIKGFFGALVSLVGVILPSVIMILGILIFLGGELSNPLLDKFFTGASAAVTAQIAHSVFRFSKSLLRDVFSLIVAAGVLALVVFTSLHPLLIMGASFLIRLFLPHPKANDQNKNESEQ